MKHTLRRVLFAVGSLVLGVAGAESPTLSTTLPGRDGATLTMFADDPVMLRALRRARGELDGFLKLAETPPGYLTHFSVRVALIQGTGSQYIWISEFKEGDGGLYAGVVDDDPRPPARFKRGDRFTFVRADIQDWTYTDTRKGRVVGAYSECALLTLAPADVAAKIREEHELDCAF